MISFHIGMVRRFRVALGLAMACKLNAGPVAFLLPLAVVLRLGKIDVQRTRNVWIKAFLYMAGAALVSLVIFRIFQPYAFSGPGFFGLQPNPLWVDNIPRTARSGGRRCRFSAGYAMGAAAALVLWREYARMGTGFTLGILAVAGFLHTGFYLLHLRKKQKTP